MQKSKIKINWNWNVFINAYTLLYVTYLPYSAARSAGVNGRKFRSSFLYKAPTKLTIPKTKWKYKVVVKLKSILTLKIPFVKIISLIVPNCNIFYGVYINAKSKEIKFENIQEFILAVKWLKRGANWFIKQL